MKKKVATKSRFARDAKPSRDFVATLLFLSRAIIYYFYQNFGGSFFIYQQAPNAILIFLELLRVKIGFFVKISTLKMKINKTKIIFWTNSLNIYV